MLVLKKTFNKEHKLFIYLYFHDYFSFDLDYILRKYFPKDLGIGGRHFDGSLFFEDRYNDNDEKSFILFNAAKILLMLNKIDVNNRKRIINELDSFLTGFEKYIKIDIYSFRVRYSSTRLVHGEEEYAIAISFEITGEDYDTLLMISKLENVKLRNKDFFEDNVNVLGKKVTLNLHLVLGSTYAYLYVYIIYNDVCFDAEEIEVLISTVKEFISNYDIQGKFINKMVELTTKK